MGEDLIDGFKEDFAMLIEGGLIAVKQLDEVAALRIFEAAELLSPDNMAPRLGVGYVALNKLDLKGAAKSFQEVIDKEPENHLAHVFLGMTFLFDKKNPDNQKKGAKMIREAMEKSTDPAVKTLGEASIEDWMKKEAKKKGVPFSA